MKKKSFALVSICASLAVSGAVLLAAHHVNKNGIFASAEENTKTYKFDGETEAMLPVFTEVGERDGSVYPLAIYLDNAIVRSPTESYNLYSMDYTGDYEAYGTFFYAPEDTVVFDDAHGTFSFLCYGDEIISVCFSLVKYATVDTSLSYIEFTVNDEAQHQKFYFSGDEDAGGPERTVWCATGNFFNYGPDYESEPTNYITILGIHLVFTCPK